MTIRNGNGEKLWSIRSQPYAGKVEQVGHPPPFGPPDEILEKAQSTFQNFNQMSAQT